MRGEMFIVDGIAKVIIAMDSSDDFDREKTAEAKIFSPSKLVVWYLKHCVLVIVFHSISYSMVDAPW
jgi:hypothetical protein